MVFHANREVFHAFSSLPLFRERETPPDATKQALESVRRKKHLRGDALDVGRREAPCAGSIEQHELAVPRCDVGAGEEHDEISIAWVLRDVRGDIRTPGLDFDEQHVVTPSGAQVGSLTAAERKLLGDLVAVPFEYRAELVLPELMLCTTGTRLLENDAA